MSLTINGGATPSTTTEDALSIKAAQMAKNQQQLEGQMAVQLIQSATVEPVATPSTNAVGAFIDIHV